MNIIKSVVFEPGKMNSQPKNNTATTEEKLEKCHKLQNEWKEKYLRVAADFENFKRRAQKEQAEWASRAQEGILKELLPILDDFDRAQQAMEQIDQQEKQSWLQGFQMIAQSFEKVLSSHDVKEMENYQVFDPSYHEALVQVDSQEHASGDIVQVFEKGYFLKNKVLRPAKVSVAK